MNVYIYGPKDDPYHRDHWRVPYPEAQAKRIQELNEHAKEWGVNFYPAIHPGVDIKWNDTDRDNLVKKLELMYALGIRSFAVFFDDIWGEGAKADKQAELLNYVDDNFIAKHKDISPLIMCPTEYQPRLGQRRKRLPAHARHQDEQGHPDYVDGQIGGTLHRQRKHGVDYPAH